MQANTTAPQPKASEITIDFNQHLFQMKSTKLNNNDLLHGFYNQPQMT